MTDRYETPADEPDPVMVLLYDLMTMDGWPEVNVNAWMLAYDFLSALGNERPVIEMLIGEPPERFNDTFTIASHG